MYIYIYIYIYIVCVCVWNDYDCSLAGWRQYLVLTHGAWYIVWRCQIGYVIHGYHAYKNDKIVSRRFCWVPQSDHGNNGLSLRTIEWCSKWEAGISSRRSHTSLHHGCCFWFDIICVHTNIYNVIPMYAYTGPNMVVKDSRLGITCPSHVY